MDVNANLVRELRDETGAGVMDCKRALAESQGNLEQAALWLREKGIAQAAKRAGRVASEGSIGAYIHAGGKLGVLVEINCESDFVARTEDFQRLSHDVAMHIAALAPHFVRREEVTPEIIEARQAAYREEAKASGKPDAVVEKIVNGKLEKFYEETCLYEQHFIKDEGITVKELVDQAIAKLGENISVRRFARFKVGESEAAAAGGAGSEGSDGSAPAPVK